MRSSFGTFLFLLSIVYLLPGCDSNILLRVYAVEDTTRSATTFSNPPDLSMLKPLPSVKFFFYPNATDSVIHLYPEREFVTDANGKADYSEIVSPVSQRESALIGMKPGYGVDTVFFRISPGDTVNVLFRMRPK